MSFRLDRIVETCSLDDLIGEADPAVLVVDPAVVAHHMVADLPWPVVVVPPGEPTTASVASVMRTTSSVRATTIVAVGGGSTIDTAKLAATLVQADLADHIAATVTRRRTTRLVAAPTTAGSGSEATRTSVVTHLGRKSWVWGDPLRPDRVVLEPALTASAPEAVTVSAAFDAMVHAIEAHTSRTDDPVATAAAQSVVPVIGPALAAVIEDGEDLDARRRLQIAACSAGVAIDRAGTGIAHAIGHALGSITTIPHGLAVALGLKVAMGRNIASRPDRHRALSEHLSETFAQLLDIGGYPGQLARSTSVRLDPGALDRAIRTPENRPMIDNNVWRPDDGELRQLIEDVAAEWNGG